jgi:hypothetical protein
MQPVSFDDRPSSFDDGPSPRRRTGADTARRLGRLALDLALPPRCIACGARVDAAGLACAVC